MTATEFRAALADLGISQAGLARLMAALGDPRPYETIRRGIQRMVTGHARVSGEMQALIGLLKCNSARPSA
jgi:hypothetical protein